MQLIRFGERGAEKPGVILDGERVDCSSHFEDWNSRFFNDEGMVKLQRLLDKQGKELPRIPANIRWASCVARPGMILCIGLNYSDHALESGMEVPREPILFMKATNTLQGPFDDVNIPSMSTKTDWEVELAVVIGNDSLYLESESAAHDSIAGYCIMNDLSEREFQLERGGQWVKGKSCPGFSPLGPFMLSRDSLEDVNDLNLQLSVNGESMQIGKTDKMVFKPDYLVYYISQFMKLEAGDIIATGTPPGVGLGLKPSRYLVKGDVVELSIDSLGVQKQLFV